MLSLTQLPTELLLDEILPLLSIKDVAPLFRANRLLARLGQDELFWKRRLKDDFGFTNLSLGASYGYRFLYSRMYNPEIYVWGSSDHGRLGRPVSSTTSWRTAGATQLWPLKLSLPTRSIVHLAAGGWSFTALDADGNMYVWGQLNLGYANPESGFVCPNQQATRPLRLNLPSPIYSISCGRGFTTALDNEGRIWCFNSWGRPLIYTPPILNSGLLGHRVIQVESGWSFSSALTELGTVLVWRPEWINLDITVARARSRFCRPYHLDARGGFEESGAIQCQVGEVVDLVPIVLPALPSLPNISENNDSSLTRLVKIAAGDQFIVGLTNHGHVVKIDLPTVNLDRSFGQTTMSLKSDQWIYMPLFCEREKLQELSVLNESLFLSPGFKITEISAQYVNFAAYSTGSNSIVLMGKSTFSSATKPQVMHTLLDEGLKSVVLGDYHFGALTEDGRLFTWGNADCTGLGYCTTSDIEEPREVSFDYGSTRPRRGFVSAVAAAGWHMGALVLDLEDEQPNSRYSAAWPVGSIYDKLHGAVSGVQSWLHTAF